LTKFDIKENTMRVRLFIIGISLNFIGYSQVLFKNTLSEPKTFKQLQKEFAQFKSENDLSEVKHWKYFKRYEADMQRLTNGRGEPDGFTAYVNAALQSSEQKREKAAASAPWYPIGPQNVPLNFTGYMENGIGRINCVTFHPTDPNTFFVGVAQGGLWKTNNGGVSYFPLTDHLPITRISDCVIDPNNTNVMYISVCDFDYIGFGLYLNGKKRNTHYGLGVYKTVDGGLTWNATGLSFQMTNGDASLIRKILINPSNSSELLACGVSGMYRSNDGGNSWQHPLDSLFWDMVQDPLNSNTIYAATGWVANSNLGTAAIYKSSDFGLSWSMLSTGIPMQGSVQRIKLAVAPSDNSYVYALCCDNSSGYYGLYQSTDAGNSWLFKPALLNILSAGQGGSPGGQGTYDLALCVNATNKNIIYCGGINLWTSSDGGSNFNPSSHWTLNYGPTIHGDIHFIDRQSLTGNYFVCTDGGLYKTSNIQPGNWMDGWQTVWTKLSDGMQITSFYRLSSSKNSTGRLMAGSQDNASFYYNGSNWTTIFGGDGMDNYLDPLNDMHVLGSSQYGNFYHSNNGGFSGNFVSTNPFSEAAEWVTPVVANYNFPGLLFIGNENVIKSTDGGMSWSTMGAIYTNSVTFQNTEISALAVAPTNSNVIYAARRVRYENGLNGIIFKSTNGGSTYTNITSNLPDTLYYTSLDVMPENGNHVVVSMAGFAAGCKIYKTTNGGTTWSNISYNLPNIPVNCVKYLPGSGQIMAATDIGVYVLNNGAVNWINYSLGLPNVIVSDIEFNPLMNKIYIATFGRGIWESDLALISSLQNISPGKPTQFNLYPSIGEGQFTVELEEQDISCRLDVIDVHGRVVHSEKIREKKNNISFKSNPGVYYVRIEKNNVPGVKKIIIQ
jgi:photosystem II stability/assembly factor-like uncharacterized protein